MPREKQLNSNQFLILTIALCLSTNLCVVSTKVFSLGGKSAIISLLIAMLYPIIIFYLYSYIYIKYPKDSLYTINRIVLGKIIGNSFNVFMFLLVFVYSIIVLCNTVIISRNTVFWYLSDNITQFIILSIAMVVNGFKLRSHLKATKIFTIVIAIAMIEILLNIRYGDIKNLTPVFDESIKNIWKTSMYSVFFFSGFEVFVMYLPLLKNQADYKKNSIKFILYVFLLVAFIIEISIYYWGDDTLKTLLYPVLTLMSLYKTPFVSNFMFIFVTILILFNFSCFSMMWFSCNYSLQEIFQKHNYKIFVIPLFILFTLLSKLYCNITDLMFLIVRVYYPLIAIFTLNIVVVLLVDRRNTNEG